jgi:hypothetical protein
MSTLRMRADSHFARSVACRVFPQLVWNAFRAALTALSTSSFVPWANESNALSLTGFFVSKVLPSQEADHLLLLPRQPDPGGSWDIHEDPSRDFVSRAKGRRNLSVG